MGKEGKMSGGQTALKMRKRQTLPWFIIHGLLFMVLWLGLTPNPAAAQTTSVAVMPFAGDEPALSSRIRDAAIGAVENLEGSGFTPQPLDVAVSQPDAPPDPSLLEGTTYVLTGEYYFDDEDMQHFQMWLWNSESGALVFTDELVAENAEEAEGYLPRLVSWVFSKAEPAAAEEEEEVAAVSGMEEITEETGPEDKPLFPRLYLGLRGGAALDFQSVRPAGNYEAGMDQSFGGEGALTVEYRPWRYLSFQAEGIFALEAFAPYRLGNSRHTSDRYLSMYLLFPLLVKLPLSLDNMGLSGFRLSPLAGPYFILPLRTTMGGSSYQDKLDLPLGVMAGFDLGYVLGGGKFGEIYGSLRYGIDLGLTTVEQTGLRYTRSRLVFSVGWKYMILGREDGARNKEQGTEP
jgi:hypothetical protein